MPLGDAPSRYMHVHYKRNSYVTFRGFAEMRAIRNVTNALRFYLAMVCHSYSPNVTRGTHLRRATPPMLHVWDDVFGGKSAKNRCRKFKKERVLYMGIYVYMVDI